MNNLKAALLFSTGIPLRAFNLQIHWTGPRCHSSLTGAAGIVYNVDPPTHSFRPSDRNTKIHYLRAGSVFPSHRHEVPHTVPPSPSAWVTGKTAMVVIGDYLKRREPVVDSQKDFKPACLNISCCLFLRNCSNFTMSASFQQLISQSHVGFNRFAIARGTKGCRDAVPTLLAKRDGFDTWSPVAQFFRSKSSSQEQVRICDALHKETLHHEISNTRVSGEDNIGRKQFADYDLTGRGFIATDCAQGLGLSMTETLADAGGRGEP